MSLGDLDEVDEHPRPLVCQAIAVDLLAVKRADEGEVAAHGAQDLSQRVGTGLAREDAEVVDDAPVWRLREAHGHDEGLAGEAHGLRGADDHEGFGRRRVKERGQAGFLGAHRLQGVADAPGVAVGQGDDGEGAFGRFHRVFDDGVDDGTHLGGCRFDGVRAGGGHARRLDPAGAHGRVRGRPRDRNARVLVAVAGQQQGDLVVEAARAGLDVQDRQDARKVAGRATLRGRRQIVDDDQLVAAGDNRRKLGQGQPVRTVEDDEVDGASRGSQGGNHRGNRHQHG